MSSPIVSAVNRWYRANARPLPWRLETATAWHVLISEFMLQQTPVARVLPMYDRWIGMFPVPSALATQPVSTAVREWGRLGYPRRAQRLHAASVVLDTEYDDEVPADLELLKALPGVGEYTAAAVMAFAFAKRSVVVDTNVRRVLTRAVLGQQWPAPNLSRTEMALAESLVPKSDAAASTWSAGVMELGAVVCTVTKPNCEECPIARHCAWRSGGYIESPRPNRTQAWHGTDRQCRGAIVQMLRDSEGPVANAQLRKVWEDAEQFKKCLLALRSEGLVVRTQKGWTL